MVILRSSQLNSNHLFVAEYYEAGLFITDHFQAEHFHAKKFGTDHFGSGFKWIMNVDRDFCHNLFKTLGINMTNTKKAWR